MAEIHDVSHQNVDTEARIVQSPDRIKRSISDQYQQQANLKSENAIASRALREIHTRLDLMTRLEAVGLCLRSRIHTLYVLTDCVWNSHQDLKTLITLESSIDAECRRVDGVRKDISRLHDELHSGSTTLASLDADINVSCLATIRLCG